MESDNTDTTESKKLSGNQWTLVDKPLSEFEIKSNTILFEFGKNANCNISTTESRLTTIGEYYYHVVRDELKTQNLLVLPFSNYNQEQFEKTLGKNKKNKIILDNCKKTVNNQIATLNTVLRDSPQDKIYEDLMNGYDCIEFRIIILMKIIEFHSKTNKYNTTENVPAKEELLIASKKILHALENKGYFTPLFSIPTVELTMCSQLIEDLRYKIELMLMDFNVKLYDIANKRPKLIYNTKYDCTVVELRLKLHDTQVEAVETVKNNFNNGSLVIYKTLTGLGKTSTVLAIASYIISGASVTVTNGVAVHNIMLFCCSDMLDAVRIQVLRLIRNFKIKLGVCTVNEDEPKGYKITKSFICGKDEPVFLVCDYASTYLLLKEAEAENSKKKYTLFFDEPTVLTDHDTPNNKTLEILVKILYHLPKNTILSSATFPQITEFQPIIDHYRSKYPDAVVKEIKSNKTLIGCVIKDFTGSTITPHICCKTPQELANFIDKIKHYPLLGKFYTLPFLINLNEFLKGFGLNCDLDAIETFEHENIVENVLILLERVATNLSGTAFEQFLSIKIVDVNDMLSIDATKVDADYGKICPNKFIMQHAFKFFGCCWIASDNPEQFIATHFASSLALIRKKLGGNTPKGTIYQNIGDVYEKYMNAKTAYDHAVTAEITKANAPTPTTKKTKCKTEDRTKGYDALENNIQRIEEPKFEFPKFLQINTHEHIKMFAKYVEMYDSSMLKVLINPETCDLTKFEVSDDLKFLLLMGVGVYSKSLCPNYSVKVLELLQARQLAFVIAGKEFCYGANYQLSCLLLYDEIMDNYSIDTILQSIGRTSRIGKSESGRVYLDVNTTKRITDFFANPSYRSAEGINIAKWFLRYKTTMEPAEELATISTNPVVAPQQPTKDVNIRLQPVIANTIQINGTTKKIIRVNEQHHSQPPAKHFLANPSQNANSNFVGRPDNQRLYGVERPVIEDRFNVDLWRKPVAVQQSIQSPPIVEERREEYVRNPRISPLDVPNQDGLRCLPPRLPHYPPTNELENIWKRPTNATTQTSSTPNPIPPRQIDENTKRNMERFDVNLFGRKSGKK